MHKWRMGIFKKTAIRHQSDNARRNDQAMFSHGRECRDLDECGRNVHDCALNSKSGFERLF